MIEGLVVAGVIVGYVVMAGLTASIYVRIRGNDGLGTEVLVGAFWPVTVPFALARYIGDAIPEWMDARKRRRELAERETRARLKALEKELGL